MEEDRDEDHLSRVAKRVGDFLSGILTPKANPEGGTVERPSGHAEHDEWEERSETGMPAEPLVSGIYVLGERVFHVDVPPSLPEERLPVIISLHAFNEHVMGSRALWHGQAGLRQLMESHILVFPEGVDMSWNCHAEPSLEDDVSFIGKLLLDHLAARPNVRPEFKLYGMSNGSSLVHRICIEIDDPRIVAAITDSTQLDTKMYDEQAGAFMVGGLDNTFATAKGAILPRSMLAMVGKNDKWIPAGGGESSWLRSDRNDPDAKLTFLPWQMTPFYYARASGYSGPEEEVQVDHNNRLSTVRYLDGQVAAVMMDDVGHGEIPYSGGDAIILEFFSASPPALPKSLPKTPAAPLTPQPPSRSFTRRLSHAFNKRYSGNRKDSLSVLELASSLPDQSSSSFVRRVQAKLFSAPVAAKRRQSLKFRRKSLGNTSFGHQLSYDDALIAPRSPSLPSVQSLSSKVLSLATTPTAQMSPSSSFTQSESPSFMC
jgi:hypothetical protein